MILPQAFDAAVTLLRNDPNLGSRVFDGPQATSVTMPEVVTVGADGSTDPTAVEGSSSVEGLAVSSTRGSFTIRGAVSVLDASGFSVARARAFELLGYITADLQADPSLGGLPVLATLGAVSVLQWHLDGGPTVTVSFQVDLETLG